MQTGFDINELFEEQLDEYAYECGFIEPEYFLELYGEYYVKNLIIMDKSTKILIKNSIPVDKNGNKLNVSDMPVVAEVESRTD